MPSAITPAERAGCCLAGAKETCSRPPCPMNPDAWGLDDAREAKRLSESNVVLLRARSFTNADVLGRAS